MSFRKISILARKYELKHNFYVKADISLDQTKIVPNAIEVCKMLQDNGFKAYLVGGCVRDLLMGANPKDWDIATNAKPDQTKSIFPKTYDTGIEHGTITVSMGPTVADHFEVTTFRVEGDYTDGRRPDSVEFVDDIENDLSRRDLTINAIAYDPVNKKVVDPFGGLQDLNNKVIKAVGDPNARFAEDGLRTMRVARFAARLGFSVDPKTESAISNNLAVLAKVSKERMRDELTKTLVTANPSVGLNILQKTGALSVLGSAFADPSLASTFSQIDACKGSMETKVAVMLHNSDVTATEKALRDLKFSNIETKKILFPLIGLKEFMKFSSAPSGAEARRFLAFVKNTGPEGFEKSLSEFFGFGEAIGLDKIEELKTSLHEPAISKKELDISGNDLMTQLNIPPGPKIKKILDALYNEVISNPEMNQKAKLLELATKFETMAFSALNNTMTKTAADWWRLSDTEEKDLLNKEFDFGGGLKFKAKDIPELASQVEVPAGPEKHHPEKNQLLHNNMVFDQAKKLSDDPMVWFSALLHDLGKSYTDKAIWPKQHGHEVGGVPYVERVSNLLGVPENWKNFAKLVAEHHLNCHRAKELSPKALRKLFESFNSDKTLFNSYLTSCEADAKGRMGGYALQPYDQKPYLAQKVEEGFEPKKQAPSTLAISGDDLIREFGLKPGQQLGLIIKNIKEMVAANPELNDHQTLMDIARNSLAK